MRVAMPLHPTTVHHPPAHRPSLHTWELTGANEIQAGPNCAQSAP